MATSCPECDANVRVEDSILLNEIVECPDCSSELEVIGREPLMLAIAPEPEEDWGE